MTLLLKDTLEVADSLVGPGLKALPRKGLYRVRTPVQPPIDVPLRMTETTSK